MRRECKVRFCCYCTEFLTFVHLTDLLHPALYNHHKHLNCGLFACSALGVPVTDHTYEDCRLMISAGELTLPMEAGLVEFTKISRKLQ